MKEMLISIYMIMREDCGVSSLKRHTLEFEFVVACQLVVR